MNRSLSSRLTRRDVLVAGAALAGALPSARAQSLELSVFGHRVHQAAATTGAGGDVTAAWREASKNTVSWVTLGDVNAIHERFKDKAKAAPKKRAAKKTEVEGAAA